MVRYWLLGYRPWNQIDAVQFCPSGTPALPTCTNELLLAICTAPPLTDCPPCSTAPPCSDPPKSPLPTSLAMPPPLKE
jgi:hypothetical protein